MGKARNEEANGQTQKRPGDPLDDQKPAKRTRVSRACDQCRASREKCDGAQPHCQSCILQERECTYNEAPKKRGIQPNYIRTLELLLAWSFEHSPELAKDLRENLPLGDSSITQLLAGKDVEAAEKLHQSWRTSTVGRQIDQVLSGTTVEHGSAAGEDDRRTALMSLGAGIEPMTPEKPSKLKLPDNAWVLLDYYFAYVHSWMPMTEKSSMMKLIYAYPADGITFEQATQAEHAELWSIMAVASYQVRAQAESNETESLRVRNIAELLVPTGKTYEVPHLKAMMLLTLIDMSEGRTLDAWLRIGTMVRLLSLFKLLEHLDYSTKWCRHVHLAAFLLESALALRMNARPHLTPEYTENIGFINEDGRDEWDPWQDPMASSFNVSRAPARSFSTLNKLVRSYMQHLRTDTKSTEPASGNLGPDIVFDLLRNACLPEDRLQPAVILDGAQCSSSGNILTNVPNDAPQNSTSPSWSALSQHGTQSAMPPSNYPYMSIPNDMTEMPTSTVAPIALDGSSSTGGADIFQELAMLERTDSSNQFMQNLGFAPDLDLQEFFGDAYQASDPMLSLMHPTSSGVNFGASENT